MALGQERMKVKQRLEVDAWSMKEKMELAAAVVRSGDQNWMAVSRMLRPFSDPSRPPDWFSQKNCAVQYASLLENAETPKRKKRNEKGESQIETQNESILRKVTQERIEEIKRLMQEKRTAYMKLKEEEAQVKSGYADDRLDELCQKIDVEKERKAKLAEDHIQWLKEREKIDVDRTWKPPVAIPHRRKIKTVARRNSNQSDPNSEVDSAQDSPLNDLLNVEVANEDASETLVEPKPPSQTPTSPLLTSLLKSPSPAPTSQTSILHSAITSHRGSSPTITSLLNSAPGIPVSTAPPTTVSPSLKNLVSSAISGAGMDHPPVPTSSPAAGAPTLSMLLELPPSLPGKPLPELPSTITLPASTVPTVPPAVEEASQPQPEEPSGLPQSVTEEHVETEELVQPKEEPVEVLIEEVVMNDDAIIGPDLLTTEPSELPAIQEKESKGKLDESATAVTENDSKNEEKGAEAEQPVIKPTAPSPEKEIQVKEEKCEVVASNESVNESEEVTENDTQEALINTSENTNNEPPIENVQEVQSTEMVSTTVVDEVVKEMEMSKEESVVATRTEEEVPDLENMEVIILGKSQDLEQLQVESVRVNEESNTPEQKHPQKDTKEGSNEAKKEEVVEKSEQSENTMLSKDTSQEQNASLEENASNEKNASQEKDTSREETFQAEIPPRISIETAESVKIDEALNSESRGETTSQTEFKRTLRSSSDTTEVDTDQAETSTVEEKDVTSKVSIGKEKGNTKDDSNSDLSVDKIPAKSSLDEAKEPASENNDLKENRPQEENEKECITKESNFKGNKKKEMASKKDVSLKGNTRKEMGKEVSKEDDISKEQVKKGVPSNKEDSENETSPVKEGSPPPKTSKKVISKEKQKKNKRRSSINKEDQNKSADTQKKDSRSEPQKRNAKDEKEEEHSEDDKEHSLKQKKSPEKEVSKDTSKELQPTGKLSSKSESAKEVKNLSSSRETKRRDSIKKETPKKDSKDDNKKEILRRSSSKEEKRESPVKEDLKKGGLAKDRFAKDALKGSPKGNSDETKDEEKKSKRRPQGEMKNGLSDTKRKRKRKIEDGEKDRDSTPPRSEVKDDQDLESDQKQENVEEVKPDHTVKTVGGKTQKARPESPMTEDEKQNEVETPRGGGKKRLGASNPFDSVPNSPAPSVSSDEEREYRAWKKSIMLVYNQLATHKYASLFLRPITDDQAPGYSSFIHKPIDLLVIKKNVETGVTRTTKDFQRDVMLMFSNSIMYNKCTHFVHTMAQQMQEECLQHIQDFLTAQMLVQSLGETPVRRETRTTEANKHKDALNISSGPINQDETENTTGGKRKRSTVLEPEKSTKRRKVED